jgi:hypothetical protein
MGHKTEKMTGLKARQILNGLADGDMYEAAAHIYHNEPVMMGTMPGSEARTIVAIMQEMEGDDE